MSLTKEDVSQIRDIVIEGMELFTTPIHEKLDEHSRILREHSRLLGEHSRLLYEHSNRFTAIELRLSKIEDRLDWIEGQIQALLSDIKELYDLTAVKLDPNFQKLDDEAKIRTLYKYVTETAKAMNIKL